MPNRVHLIKTLETNLLDIKIPFQQLELSKESSKTFGSKNVSEAQGSNVTSEESRSPPRWRGKKNRRRESRLLLSRIYFESTSVNSFNERLKSLRLYSVHSETRATLSLSPPLPPPTGFKISFRARLYASLGSPSLIRDAG